VKLGRRRFLTTSLLGGGAAALMGCSSDDDTTAGAGAAPSATEPVEEVQQLAYVPFRGAHQAGITHPQNAQGLLAALTVTSTSGADLQAMFRTLSAEIERLMEGQPYEDRGPGYPPLYTGAVGNPPPPADLTVTVSVGASLFDERFGLGDRTPIELVTMPLLANDKLDPSRSHGDLLLTISSYHEDLNLFALRQLMRATRRDLVLKWMLDGYNRRTDTTHDAGAPGGGKRPGGAGVRNLMGFVDGTANLTTADDVLDRYVWIGDDDGEPAWAVGGSYHVVRAIRMFVEFWDRTRLSEQEALIGRRKSNGAPLDGTIELDVPDYAADPDGSVTPLDAHIRLANPRTPQTQDSLILRRGINFSRGFDSDGHLDQGLAFVSFQRRMGQFLATQARLEGEPLEEYIEPQGGGFFLALPGVSADPSDFLGRALVS
jgi:deferrochelatase/peroxidase EfeB